MNQQLYAEMAFLETNHWWFVGRRRILSEILTKIVDLPTEPSILEAGCGTGGNISMFAQFGKVSAFEPDADARRLASEKGTFDIRDGKLPQEVPFTPEGFDLISALDVLEHVEEDTASLFTLRNYLRPGGWILITVPAYSFLWSAHDENHHHKRRYSKRELVRIVKEAGFCPVTVTHFNTLLFPFVAIIRLMKNMLGVHGINDCTRLFPLGNAILKRLFSFERYLIGKISLPVGLSLLLLARKTTLHDHTPTEEYA